MSAMTDILYEAVELVGDARLAGVVGYDGIGVEMIMDVEHVTHDIETAELELACFLSSAAKTAYRLNVGMVRDIILQTDELTYLLAMIIPGYYAVMGVVPDTSIEHAQSVVWHMVNRFQTEL